MGRKPEDPGWGFLLGLFVGAPLFAVGGLVAYFVTFMAALMFLEASG